jgi:hypothetical protein
VAGLLEDVFFVISGYLITRNIYSDINNAKYSITYFYNRRIRRIFPALYTLYIFCIAVAFFLSFPSEAEAIGRRCFNRWRQLRGTSLVRASDILSEHQFSSGNRGGCIPIIGGKSNDPLCSGMMKYIYEEFLPRAHLDGIIISARWGPEDIQAAIQTAQAFLPYEDRVFLFGPLADYDQALPRILARATASGKSESKLAETHRRADSQEVDRTFSSALKDGPVEYVSVS